MKLWESRKKNQEGEELKEIVLEKGRYGGTVSGRGVFGEYGY